MEGWVASCSRDEAILFAKSLGLFCLEGIMDTQLFFLTKESTYFVEMIVSILHLQYLPLHGMKLRLGLPTSRMSHAERSTRLWDIFGATDKYVSLPAGGRRRERKYVWTRPMSDSDISAQKNFASCAVHFLESFFSEGSSHQMAVVLLAARALKREWKTRNPSQASDEDGGGAGAAPEVDRIVRADKANPQVERFCLMLNMSPAEAELTARESRLMRGLSQESLWQVINRRTRGAPANLPAEAPLSVGNSAPGGECVRQMTFHRPCPADAGCLCDHDLLPAKSGICHAGPQCKNPDCRYSHNAEHVARVQRERKSLGRACTIPNCPGTCSYGHPDTPSARSPLWTFEAKQELCPNFGDAPPDCQCGKRHEDAVLGTWEFKNRVQNLRLNGQRDQSRLGGKGGGAGKGKGKGKGKGRSPSFFPTSRPPDGSDNS